MSRADELFSRYGSSGRVEVEGYAVSEIVKRKKKSGPKLEQNLGSKKILSSQVENSEKEQSEAPKIPEESKSVDSEIRLAFAFQSKGWAGTLMDRLNTFSYKDLYKKRIAKVKAKTADIRNRVEAVRKYKKSE